ARPWHTRARSRKMGRGPRGGRRELVPNPARRSQTMESPEERRGVPRHSLRWSICAGIVLAVLSGFAQGDSPRDKDGTPRIRSVRITILSTMLADTKGLGEWGFAALVEADGRRLLFDTGARPDTVLANARELSVDLSDVTDVILSHHHADHTGGLLPLRRAP